MKKTIFAILAAAVAAVSIPISLAGCGSDGDVLKINEVTHSVFYAPMYLADALGYYEEEGFEVQFTNGGGADNTMAAVLSGSADVGFCGPEAALYVVIGGSSDAPQVFGQLTKRDGSFLVSRTDEAATFSWSDLEGKTVLAGRQGGVPAMTFEYTLKSLGINATLNYDVDFNYMTAAFESGIADYCTMFEPTATEYANAGKGYIVASVGEQSGEIPYTCFMAKSSYIQSNPDRIEGLLRAVTKAVKYINENSSTVVAGYLTAYFDGTSAESLANSVQSYKDIDAWVANMAMEEQAYERLLDIIDSAGELERRVDFGDLVITETAQKVYEEVYA
ncbi:MAG: ABC transporter substrate-binding protein [Clostridia bacterium]|nr:ABC transporter substrate-binding protein [Clostridia bacterium]